MMGIKRDNLDALFISDRDGKPYKIRWDIMGGRGVSDAPGFRRYRRERQKIGRL